MPNMLYVNQTGGFSTISAAIASASAGDTIIVAAGTYPENIIIDKSLTLLSADGAATTTIVGQGNTAEGVVTVASSVTNVTFGGLGQGFTVQGIDNVAPAIESGAILLNGANSNISIIGNNVVANGDLGLFTKFGLAYSNIVIDSNEFSGQTFIGNTVGNGDQFTVANVPRPLVFIGTNNGAGTASPATNVTFTNNQVTGTAGGVDGAGAQRGNFLVNIDAGSSTVANNTFTGFTNGSAAQLRVREENTSVQNNNFENDTGNVGMVIDPDGAPGMVGGNTLDYGAGNDTIFAVTGNDTIDGGDGVDTYDMTLAGSGGSFVDLQSGQSFSSGTGFDTISNIENLRGSAGSDALSGDAGANTFFATAGNDNINGRDGVDTFDASTASTTVNVNLSNGAVTGAFTATLQNIENAIGGSAADTFVSKAGVANVLDGKGGIDQATFAGNVADFTFAKGAGSSFTVTETASSTTDTVISVEKLIFDDQTVLLVGAGGYASIQDAVFAAGANTTILVATGTYTGQLLIDGKTNLTIKALDGANVTIKAPLDVVQTGEDSFGYDLNSIVSVEDSINVRIEGINVDGDGRADTVDGARADYVGVTYRNSSGNLVDVDITGIRDPYELGTTTTGGPIVSGMQRGYGVVVDNDTNPLAFSMTGGSITDYQKGAAFISNATLNISGVTVTGGGAQPINAQNGFQVSGSTGTIANNVITQIGYSGPADAYSGGLILYGNTNLNVTGNTITGTNGVDADSKVFGVFVFGDDNSGGAITGNTISGVDRGIDVTGEITANIDISDNSVTGLDLDDDYAAGLSLDPDSNSAALDVSGTEADDLLNGADGNDSLSGGDGDDKLDGRDGADAMDGGDGDDIYTVNDAGDTVVELADEGIDTVLSSVDYTLTADVENLTLDKFAASGTGNALDNTIVGSINDNTLKGGAGDDTLNGGDGTDTAVYDEAIDPASIAYVAGKWTVTSGTDEDKLTSIEKITSASGTLLLVGGDGYATIQDAIGAAESGDTILLAAGTYDLSAGLTITKDITILGANHGDAGADGRMGESILIGPSSGAMIAIGSPVGGLNITIDGVKMVGDHILNAGTPGDTFTLNNSVLELTTNAGNAIYYGYGGSYEFTFQNNYVESAGYSDGLLMLFEGGVFDIAGNTFVGAGGTDGGLQAVAMNLNGSATVSASGTVADNTFVHMDIGVMLAGAIGDMTVSGNEFTDAASGGNYGTGILLFDPRYTGEIDISENDFEGLFAGIRSSSFNSGSVQGLSITIDGNTFSANTHDVRALASGVLQLTDSTVDGEALPSLFVGGPSNDEIVGTSNADVILAGDGSDTIISGGGNDTIEGGLGIDIVQFAKAASAYTVSNDGSGNRTVTDNDTGDVTTVSSVERLNFEGANTLYVGTSGYATLAAAIEAATAGDTIIIGSGVLSDTGSVVVDKALTIRGFYAGVSGASEDRVAASETVLNGGLSINAAGVVIDGLTVVGGAMNAGNASGIYIDHDDVTITNTVLTGVEDGPFYGFVTPFGGEVSGLSIDSNLVTNWVQGGYFNPTTQFTVTNNSFDNNGNAFVGDDWAAGTFIDGNTFSNSAGSTVGYGVLEATVDVGAFFGENTYDTAGRKVGIYLYGNEAGGQTVTGTDQSDRIDAEHAYVDVDGNDVIDGGAGDDLILSAAGDDTLDGGTGSDTINGGTGTDSVAGYGAGAVLSIVGGKWTVTDGSDVDTLTNVEKVTIDGDTYILVDNLIDGGFDTLQAAIDAASGGETILVAPGSYTESANYNSSNNTNSSNNPVGLLINKNNITIQGVDATGAALASGAALLATVNSGVQSGWGTNFHVTGDGVTIKSLDFVGKPSGGAINKVFEVVGDDFTLQFSSVGGPNGANVGSAIYINDEVVPVGSTNWVSNILSYLIDNNVLEGAVVVTNGAGFGHDAADVSLVISNNSFVLNTGATSTANWGIILNGEQDGTGWRNAPVALPDVTGNSFTSDYTIVLRARDDNPDNLPDRAYVDAFLTANSVGAYAFVTDKFGEPRSKLVAGTPDNDLFNIYRTAALAAADGTAGDTVVVSTNGASVTETIGVSGLTIDAQANSDLDIVLGAGVAELSLAGTVTVDVTGNGDDNTITGNAAANSLFGGLGADTLKGGGGEDTLLGENGDDMLNGGGGSDSISGGAGTDTAAFDGAFGDYSIVRAGSSYIVTDEATGDTDFVTGVEAFSFNGGPTVSVVGVANQDNVVSTRGPSITGVADASPDEDGNPATIDIAENAALGAIVATVTASDQNLAAGDVLTYVLENADGSAYAGPFAIDQTGAIIVSGALDFETVSSETFTVRVTDTNDQSVKQSVTVAITAANDAPTAIALDANPIFENADGDMVGEITVTDPDAGDTFTFAVDDARFEVKTVGSQYFLQLKEGESVDFEDTSTIKLGVTATDSGGESVSGLFTVDVTDVNEAPTAISLDKTTVVEGLDGAEVGQLTVTDEDAGDTASFEVDDLRFEVVSLGGLNVLKLREGISLDFETDPTTILTIVTVTDGGANTINERFTITVTDVNEDPAGQTTQDVSFEEGVTDAPIVIVPLEDPENGAVTYTVTDLPLEGTVKLGGVALTVSQVLTQLQIVALTYTLPDAALAGGALGLQASDGSNIVTLTVNLAVTEAESKTYSGTAGVDRLDGAAGNDEVLGLAGADILLGGSGDDRLDGGSEADEMNGGDGNDTFVVDNAGDMVVETFHGGTDTVEASLSHALADGVENLTLTGSANINGTGNGLGNTLTGNSGANILDGGEGQDQMEGGAGNDTYYVNVRQDQVVEGLNAGTDHVFASVFYTLGDNVENLTLLGPRSLSASGNGLANTITGNNGDNIIDGGLGADTMIGSRGNDTYIVDNAGDMIFETAGNGGIDTVQSSISVTLAVNVENLTLTGAANINGTGERGNNTIVGNGGNNVLNGLIGDDTLTGGAGQDAFVFNTRLLSLGDAITDFAVGVDKIHLDNEIFAKLGPDGALNANMFVIGAPQDANDRLVYDISSGVLSYDVDGNGAKAAVRFAELTDGTALTATDFLIV